MSCHGHGNLVTGPGRSLTHNSCSLMLPVAVSQVRPWMSLQARGPSIVFVVLWCMYVSVVLVPCVRHALVLSWGRSCGCWWMLVVCVWGNVNPNPSEQLHTACQGGSLHLHSLSLNPKALPIIRSPAPGGSTGLLGPSEPRVCTSANPNHKKNCLIINRRSGITPITPTGIRPGL